MEAILFLLGLVLLLAEIFMPGFGVPGICGLICIGVASVLAANTYGAVAVAGVLAVMVLIGYILFRVIKKKRLYRGLVLEDTLSDQVYDQKSIDLLMGKKGVALTPLKPGGKAEFGGKAADVASNGEYIPKDSLVEVIGIQGRNVIVRICQSENQDYKEV